MNRLGILAHQARELWGCTDGESIPITGEIVYMSSVDNTVNVKSHFGGSIVNIGKEILKLNLLSPNNKKYDAR